MSTRRRVGFGPLGWLSGRGCALVLAAAALCPAGTRAEAADGALSGVVRDPAGAVVPGATVRVLSEAGAPVTEVATDGTGAYRVPALVSGTYRVEAALSGFEPARRRVAVGAGQAASADLSLGQGGFSETTVVTARRVEETLQEVPIAVSAVAGDTLKSAGAFNVDRLKELVPTVQFYSSNPRNSAISIRGLGAPFGLTNDGIEPGVGLYVDGVFFARPAAATLDFIDVERVEVLRGPQGTLFGKNTTAGGVSIVSRRPSFVPEGDLELSYGSSDFAQAKGAFSSAFGRTVAGRLSFSRTGRDGNILNTATGERTNVLDNTGVRGQLLFAPSSRLAIVASVDHSRQRPDGYAQVVAGVTPTLRPANRQWAAIAADLRYAPPSYDAFDRLVDTDTEWRSTQGLGGASLTADWTVGGGRVTSVTAWRYWDWAPSNDRDFTGLPVTTISAANSKQRQWTQEFRWAGDLAPRLQLVAGVFAFQQSIDSDPSFKQEQGAAAARVLLAPTAAAATPGLLDGYGYDQFLEYRNRSTAAFAQVKWAVTDRLSVLPGVRVNYDEKDVAFDQTVYGGLQTTNAALVALQRSILAPQSYTADVDDTNTSGQLTVAYELSAQVHTYATGATGFKSVGLNLNGLPTDANNQPILSAAEVRPERVRHYEVGLKTQPLRGVSANLSAFDTTTRDYQTQVVNAQVGVLRGYLANAEKVRVRGAELDVAGRFGRRVSVAGAAAYTDGKYLSFPDAPPPLEETGGPQVKDISGSVLPGISKWAFSLRGEYGHPVTFLGPSGRVFGAVDASYRTEFSSSPSASRFLVVDGYELLNARVGVQWGNGWDAAVWSRNVLDTEYFQFLSAAPGGTGLYVGLPGDPRTFGVTLRYAFRR
ncbi:MAG: TonB-dependent receptor [Vicinamibacteria bacterium]